MIPLPGHIIPVADSLLAGREVGGRISTAAGRVVTLDRDTQAKPGDRLIINLPGGRVEGRTVQSVNKRAVTVTTNYSEAPLPQLQWALDADDLAIPLYPIVSRAPRTLSATSTEPRCSTQLESSMTAASRASWFSLILKSREGSGSEFGIASPRLRGQRSARFDEGFFTVGRQGQGKSGKFCNGYQKVL